MPSIEKKDATKLKRRIRWRSALLQIAGKPESAGAEPCDPSGGLYLAEDSSRRDAVTTVADDPRAVVDRPRDRYFVILNSPESPPASNARAFEQTWRRLDRTRIKPHHVAFVTSLATKTLGLLNNWLVIRIAIPTIGAREFGVFGSIVALSSVLAMFDLGVGTTLVNTAAAFRASPTAVPRRALRSALGSTVVYGLIAAIALPSIAFAILRLRAHDSVSSGTVFVCMVYAALFVAWSATQKLFIGLQSIWLGYGVAFVGAMMTSVALAVVAHTSAVSIPALLIAVMLPAPVLTLIGLAAWFMAHPALRPTLQLPRLSRSTFRLPEGFGIYLCQTGSILVYSAPVWVSASVSGSSTAGIAFALTRLVAPWVLITALYTQPLWPEYSRLFAIADGSRVSRMVKQSVAITLAAGIVGLIGSLTFGDEILSLLHVSASTVQLLAALCWTLLIAARQCLMAPIFASGRVRLPAIAFGIAVVAICVAAITGPGVGPTGLFIGFAGMEVFLLATHYVAYRAIARHV